MNIIYKYSVNFQGYSSLLSLISLTLVVTQPWLWNLLPSLQYSQALFQFYLTSNRKLTYKMQWKSHPQTSTSVCIIEIRSLHPQIGLLPHYYIQLYADLDILLLGHIIAVCGVVLQLMDTMTPMGLFQPVTEPPYVPEHTLDLVFII